MLYSVQETCTRKVMYKKPCQTVRFLVQVSWLCLTTISQGVNAGQCADAVVALHSEFGGDSDEDDSYCADNDEEMEKLKRRKLIMDEFRRRRRNHVSITICLYWLIIYCPYCIVFVPSFFLSVSTITHEPLHLGWGNFVRTRTLTTSKTIS